MPQYAPQPYRQLAEAYRNAGDEEQAKKVLIAQQDASRATLNQASKAWHWVSGWTVRYGYRPGHAFAGLVGVLVVSCITIVFAESKGLLIHPSDGRHCSVVETIGFTVNHTLPLLRFATYGSCTLTKSGSGCVQTFYLGMLLLQALGWALLTLFVAGFTGIIRKPST
ncbi:hypothetical protein ACWD4O_46195 [Streptomyces sp. NPDC002623]